MPRGGNKGDVKMVTQTGRKVDLSFVRGDTYSFDIDINIKTVPDEIYFTVKEDAAGTPLIQKRLTVDNGIINKGNGVYNVQLNPEDTKDFDCNLMYKWDLQIVIESYKRTPVYGTLNLIEDITKEADE